MIPAFGEEENGRYGIDYVREGNGARAVLLVIGALAGWIAGKIMKGGGFGLVGNIVVGVVGAFIGGYVFGTMGIFPGSLVGSLITAVIGAVILLFIIGLIKKS